jgi:putative inorganic carbon (HCO3(-)) transporter
MADRLAFLALLALAACLGLGDIAPLTPINTVVLHSVHALLPLALGLALVAQVRKRQWPAFPAGVGLAVAAWLAVMLLSAAAAPANRAEALSALQRPASGVLLAWAVCAVCSDRRRWRQLAQAIALGGLAVAVLGLAQASGVPVALNWLEALHDGLIPIGDVPRITSTLSHPNVAAVVLEVSLPLVIAWTWSGARRWRIPLSLGVIATLVAVALTFSRAGIVAGMSGLLILAGICVARGDWRRLALLSVAALAVPATLAWAAMSEAGLERRLTAGFGPESSVHTPAPSRLEFWTVAWEIGRDHPWLGIGPDNYRWRFSSYSGVIADDLGVHAHNQYLEALADTGWPGLAALTWLFASILRAAVGRLRLPDTDWPLRAAVVASLTIWLIHALLDDFERFWPANVAFWLIVGLSLRLPTRQPAQRLEQVFGRVALAHEAAHPSPQGLVPLLGPAAQGNQLTRGVRGSQAIQLAARAQTGQVPVEQDDGRPGALHQIDQTLGSSAISDD